MKQPWLAVVEAVYLTWHPCRCLQTASKNPGSSQFPQKLGLHSTIPFWHLYDFNWFYMFAPNPCGTHTTSYKGDTCSTVNDFSPFHLQEKQVSYDLLPQQIHGLFLQACALAHVTPLKVEVWRRAGASFQTFGYTKKNETESMRLRDL